MSSAEFAIVSKEPQQHSLSPIPGDDNNVPPPDMATAEKNSQSQYHSTAEDKTNSSEVKSVIVKEDAGVEKGELTSSSRDSEAPVAGSTKRLSRYLSKWKIFTQIFIWLLFTGWWIAGLVLHRYDYGWLIPFLLYLCITLRIIFNFVSVSHIMRPVHSVYNQTVMQVYNRIPPKYRVWSAAAGTLAVICVGSFIPEESVDNTRANRAVSIFGLLVFIAILWATSSDRKRIPWHTVIGGMLIQFIIAVFVLKTKAGYDIFNFISYLARAFLGYAEDGLRFLTSQDTVDLHYFITNVIPAIIFFIAVTQCLYHLGALQWLVVKFAHFFFWALRVSGAEAVVASASPFLGQGESAILIRPYIPYLTKAEIHQIMCSGFATIAGSVLVAYISLGLNPQALVSSCIMSIPASLAVSKLRYPETEETLTSGQVNIPDDDEERSANVLHAFTKGTWLGIKISGAIVAVLLSIIALVALINGLLGWWGRYINITQDGEPYLSLQLLLGYVCYPVAFLIGIPRPDLRKVGELIGTKIITNEFVAFSALTTEPQYTSMRPRSQLIATYALCGFGNLGSLGVQIGVLTQLAPSRAGDVARVALSALFCGIISTLTSASIAGMLVTDQRNG